MKRSSTFAMRLRADGLTLIPAGLTIAVTIAWAATGGGYESQPTLGGGYDPDPWYLGAMMLVGLLGATLLGLGHVRLSRLTKLACGAFALYVVWSFLSIAWADDKGVAFLGSDRALVYLAAFLTFAILPWRGWSMRIAVGMLVAGLGGLAILTTIRLAVLANPAALFLNARLSYPLGYYNADAAMFMMVALTAIALCSRRGAQPVLRVAGIVLGALCLQLAVLGQSRGWLFTAPIVLLLALALVPGRLRLLAFSLGPILATVAIAPTLLDVYGKATSGGVALGEQLLGATLHQESIHAVHAIVIADTILALIVAVAVLLDRRISPSEAAQRRLGRIGAGVAILAVIAGVAAGLLATHGDPVARVERAWSSFANANNTANGSSRFTTLGSQRVDFWRVALSEFGRHPLLGIGQDNFAASYLRYRKTGQEPRWTHSIELRLLTHTGLVGAILFGVFLGAVLLGCLSPGRKPAQGSKEAQGGAPPQRSRPPQGSQPTQGHGRASERAIVAIALLPLVVWLVHGSIDWLWELPALSVPALAFAAGAMTLGQSGNSSTPGRKRAKRSGRPRVATWTGAVLLWVAVLAALGVPFVAARQVQRAAEVWPRQRALAYAELRAATKLMPFDAQIYLVGGAIGLNLEEPATARRWLLEAQQQDGEAWLAPFALGLIEGEQGRQTRARSLLGRAHALNPGEPVITQAAARLGGGRPMTFAEVQRILSVRSAQRFGH